MASSWNPPCAASWPGADRHANGRSRRPMPITCEFEYHKPKTLPQAIAILSRHGKKASVLAGGTDLLVWLKEGLRIPGRAGGCQRDSRAAQAGTEGRRAVGGRLRHIYRAARIRHRARANFPLLWECSHTVASVGVRNRATLVGNICSAVPSSRWRTGLARLRSRACWSAAPRAGARFPWPIGSPARTRRRSATDELVPV